jgi:hypothetical protein
MKPTGVGMFARRKWTKEEDDRLQELKAAGMHTIAIGKELRRTTPAVMQRHAILKNREEDRSFIGDRPFRSDTITDIWPAPRKPLPQGIAEPSCAECQIDMEMMPMVPGFGHLAICFFECGRCGDITVLPETG